MRSRRRRRADVSDAAPEGARLRRGGRRSSGGGCLAVALTHLNLQRPILFGVLMALAVVTSAAKIDLPLGRSQSNLSLSHAVNFWSLFALGSGADRLHRDRGRLGPVHAEGDADETRSTASCSASPR